MKGLFELAISPPVAGCIVGIGEIPILAGGGPL